MILFYDFVKHSDELKEYFSSYGTVIEHQIMLDRNTGRSRGFGFVTFENEDAVEKIFSEGRNHELGGRQVSSKSSESYSIFFFLLYVLRIDAADT